MKVLQLKELIKNHIPDQLFIQLYYKRRMGEKLDFKNPVTFNQKLQWIKVFDHNPLYTKLVDKYEVKAYVASLIGDQYVIPTIGVWDQVSDIDFSKLPEKFVLKCTHDSGSTVVCRDKSKFDQKKAIEKLEYHLSHSFYKLFREWPYKNVKPRIIAEPLLSEDPTKHISFEDSLFAAAPDYSTMISENSYLPFELFCYKGKVVCLKYQNSGKKSGLATKDLKSLSAQRSEIDFLKTKKSCIDKMIASAEKVAESHSYMKVVFFLKNDEVFFGRISIPHEINMDKDQYKDKLKVWLDVPGETGLNDIVDIIPYTSDEQNVVESITDYKFFCFGGNVDNIMIVEDRQCGTPKFFHFSKDWRLLKYNRMGRLLPNNAMVNRPLNMDKMIEIAEKLSQNLPEVRLDLYDVNGNIYFGEYTFFHHGGYEDGFDYETNKHMGDLIVLPPKRK